MFTRNSSHPLAMLAGITSFLLLDTYTASTPTAQAELPPAVYADWKAKCPEALIIEALEVKVERGAITVSAKIAMVDRSTSGLKSGETIQIIYHAVKQTRPGPSEAIILEKGKSYRAYLSKNKNDATYGLGAGGHSFETAPVSESPQWRGQYEGEAEFKTLLITTQDAWTRVWGRIGRPAPQALDDMREMAIYIAVGERPTGGFKPGILSANERDGKYVILYTDGAPSPETFVTQVITHPWVIAIVPKSMLPVETKTQE